MSTTLSQQPRLANTQEVMSYLLTMWQGCDELPPWGHPARAAELRKFARSEPILSGALSSMVSKAASLDWQVIGGRNRVKRYQEMLANAEDGAGWSSFLKRWVQDYFGTDLGGVAELAREGAKGPVRGIYHVDAECCALTGSVSYPVRYTPKITSERFSRKKAIRFTPFDFIRITDMESTDEVKYRLGFCAVSRAVKAARVLLALYNYDEEKLADLPMPGLVTVTGLTMEELKEAFALYQATRESKQQFIFKALLWLAAQGSALQPIDAKLVSFAGLPENFDREQTFSLYIYTLALVFGVDAREFWPATQSGATKGEAEVQAAKAKGKGFGQLTFDIERALNWNVMPDGIEFQFDRRNDDDDLAREIARGQTIKNVRALWEANPATGSGIISTEEARALLVEAQALPGWLAPDENDLTLHSLDRTLPEDHASLPTPMDETKKRQEQAQQIARSQGTGNNQHGGPQGSANPLAQEAGPDRNAQRNATNAVVKKCLAAGLAPGEDVVSLSWHDEERLLWTSRRSIQVALPEGYLARKKAAISHLQAAGLLITNGALDEPTSLPVDDNLASVIATVKDLRQMVREAIG